MSRGRLSLKSPFTVLYFLIGLLVIDGISPATAAGTWQQSNWCNTHPCPRQERPQPPQWQSAPPPWQRWNNPAPVVNRPAQPLPARPYQYQPPASTAPIGNPWRQDQSDRSRPVYEPGQPNTWQRGGAWRNPGAYSNGQSGFGQSSPTGAGGNPGQYRPPQGAYWQHQGTARGQYHAPQSNGAGGPQQYWNRNNPRDRSGYSPDGSGYSQGGSGYANPAPPGAQQFGAQPTPPRVQTNRQNSSWQNNWHGRAPSSDGYGRYDRQNAGPTLYQELSSPTDRQFLMGLTIQQREALRQYTPEQIQTLKQNGQWDAAKQRILNGQGPIAVASPAPQAPSQSAYGTSNPSTPIASSSGMRRWVERDGDRCIEYQQPICNLASGRVCPAHIEMTQVPCGGLSTSSSFGPTSANGPRNPSDSYAPQPTTPPGPPASSPVYTFKEKPNGNVEVYENGQRIATGTAQYASQYGYKGPGSTPPGVPSSPSPVKPAPSPTPQNSASNQPPAASNGTTTSNPTTTTNQTPTNASSPSKPNSPAPTQTASQGSAPSTTSTHTAPSAPAPYTFQKTSDGNITVYQGGKLISSGTTPGIAHQEYGYPLPTSAPTQTTSQGSTPSTAPTQTAPSVPLPYTFVENYSGSTLLTVGVYQNGKLVGTDAPDTASRNFGFRQDQSGTYQTAHGASATNLRTTSEVLSFPQTSDGLPAITVSSNGGSTASAPQASAYSPPEIPPTSGLTPSTTRTDTFFLTNPDGTVAIYRNGTLALPKVDPAYAAQNYGYVLPGSKSNSGQAAPASSGLPTCPALATGPSGLPSCTNGQYVFVPTANNTVEVFQNGQNLAAGMSASTAATRYGYVTGGSGSRPSSATQTLPPSQGVTGTPTVPTPYTFQQTPDGQVAIYQNGQKISTGTPQYAAQYGYNGPGSTAPPAALNNPNYNQSSSQTPPSNATPPAQTTTAPVQQNKSPVPTQTAGTTTGASNALSGDTAWLAQLPSTYRQQVLSLPTSQITTMKQNGTWLTFQKEINADVYANMAPTQVQLVGDTILGLPNAAVHTGAAAAGAIGGFLSDAAARTQLQSTGLPKPTVTNTKLSNLMDQMYHGAGSPNQIGQGATSDAVRYEKLTGDPVEGVFHSAKAQQLVNGLKNWLEANPEASMADRTAAEAALTDLEEALAL